MTCSVVTVERQFTAVIKAASPFEQIPQAQQTARGALASVLPSLDAGPVGPTCTRWTRPTGSVLPMEIGVIVGKGFTAAGEVVPSELPAGHAVHLSMKGGFENLPRAWETLFHWLQAEKLDAAGINWEIYGATQDAELYALLA
jgi:effector-binding domain-containing protein